MIGIRLSLLPSGRRSMEIFAVFGADRIAIGAEMERVLILSRLRLPEDDAEKAGGAGAGLVGS